MKLCHQCQAENPDEASFCHACGAELEPETMEEAEEAIAAEAVTAEEVAEEVPDAETEDAETAEAAEPAETTEPEQPKKKSSLTALIVIAVIVVLAIAAIIGISRSGKSEPAQEPSVEAPAGDDGAQTVITAAHHSNAYGLASHSIHYEDNGDGTFAYTYLDENGETVTVSQEEIDALMEREVASCGDLSINNRQIMFYYDDQWYNFSSTYASYLSFMMNTAQGLDEQLGMDGTSTWEQLFVDSGIQMFHQIAAIAAQAEAEGFALSEEEQAELDTMAESLETTAISYGFENAEAYLKAYFGPGATLEDYLEYHNRTVYVNSFLTQVQGSVSNTAEEIAAYYEENAETMVQNYGIEKIDKPVVHVRHILIAPESTTNEDGTTSISDEAWAAAEAEAQELLADWQTNPTEDYFAGLASMHTDDPGSQSTGGLYEDIYPGQMVTEFNDWCFADGRAVGDTAIVKTSYGYHIMYFVGEGDYVYWENAASDMLTAQKMSDYIANLQAAQPLTSDQSAVVLLNSIAPTAPVEETAEAETTGETGE